jgi:23S rRNA (cytosine1962-C5)-methyltransferase
VRAGERYAARPASGGNDAAVTLFTPVAERPGDRWREIAAEPLTGRTHQIRVHASASGFAVLGDTLYGGSRAPRLCLHAERIAFRHPQSGAEVAFTAPADFDADPGRARRSAIIDAGTNAFRLVHGAADRQPEWYVEQLGEYLLSQAEVELTGPQRSLLEAIPARGIYHKRLSRRVRDLSATQASPAHVAGSAAPERFEVLENGVRFEIGFAEGYSVGLFLDQRDNRRRLLVNHVGAGFTVFPAGAAGRTLLNTFAYTCGFSVCAAIAGANVTSLDLSKKYLDWGRRNFALNGLEPAAHDFIFGDAFDWLRRLRKKGRLFDAIVLDPPTFSQSAEGGTFRAERDYGKLVAAALPVLAPGGVLLACANTARLPAEDFLEAVRGAALTAGRAIVQEHYAGQPPDFPITRDEPGHLKSVWLRVN